MVVTRAIFCAAVLLLPGVARAKFSLDVTQLDQDVELPVQALCSAETCRATVPVIVGNDLCVLNVSAGKADGNQNGKVIFALGPCRSGRQLFITGKAEHASYTLDQFGAAAKEVMLAVSATKQNSGLDDLTLRTTVTLRLAIISTSK